MPFQINAEPPLIDYQKPSCNQNDYRTTNYISHQNKPDFQFGESLYGFSNLNELGHSSISRQPDHWISEMKDTYVPKYNDPKIPRFTDLKKVNYIKFNESSVLQDIPKPIQQYDTVNRIIYKGIPEQKIDSFRKQQFENSVEKSRIKIDASLFGHYKYLDLMATTNMLDYPKFYANSLNGFGAKDIITVWNWSGDYQPQLKIHMKRLDNISKKISDKYTNPLCRMRHGEYATSVKHVPNGGLTTEFKSNYDIPDKKLVNTTDISKRSFLYTSPNTTTPWKTEASIIGSGEAKK